MIFKPELAEKALTGEKTMTRRLVKPGEYLIETVVKMVVGPGARIKWRVGQSYAIQLGRTKAAIGRFTLLDIRRERVREISEQDAIAEGVDKNCLYAPGPCSICCFVGKCNFDGEWWHYLRGDEDMPAYSAVESFLSLFESINGKAALEKEVWVLVFEVSQ